MEGLVIFLLRHAILAKMARFILALLPTWKMLWI
jgi:hypothetical protein